MAIVRLGERLLGSSPTASLTPVSLQPSLLQKAARLNALNAAFVEWAGHFGPWAAQVQLANLEAGRAAFVASSAAPLTPLRYRQAEVLAWISARTGEPCTRLSVSVRRSSPR